MGSSKPNPRRANGTRRSALRARVLAAYDTCALCGHPVDKQLPTPHPYSAEVDEVVPVAQGGDPLAWSNVQLAHRQCNQRKAAALAGRRPAVQQQRPMPVSQTW